MTKAWWHAAGIRAVRTMGQVLAAGLSALVAAQTSNLIKINWFALLSVTVLAGLGSMATAFAGLPEVKESRTYNSDI
jgi:hypothetical protein